ncbi:MAG TPA: hypothetical protein VG165_02665 [Solirubrobacteraceae bacterium]|nr:hypothetical protein [Solirubrobacteraceae bacterium]
MADKSKLPRRLAIGAAVAALGYWSVASVAADAANPFSGSWSTKAGGSAPGTLTLNVVSASVGAAQLQGFGGAPCAQPTTYYYGNYDNLGSTGEISGCTPTPDHLLGRFHSDSPQAGHSAYGDGDITFVAPNTFSGQLTYEGSSYSYTGTLATTAPSPTPPPPGSPPTTTPPPIPKPTGPPSSTPSGASPPTSSGSQPTSSTPSGSSSTSQISGSPLSQPTSLPALPGSGRVILAEPAPDASATVISPDLLAWTPAATLLSVTDSRGDFPGMTIVGPGELASQSFGETVACWLIGPDAPGIPAGVYGKSIALGFFRGRLHASDAYTTCAGVAQSILAAAAAQPAATASQAPQSGCAARRIDVAIQAHSGLITDATPVNGPVPASGALSYACQRRADGSLRISVADGLKGGLPAALGTHLVLGVVRAANAQARQATLAFAFGPSWTGSWHTTRGAMRLTQNGGRLTGTYAACAGKATVAGDVTGRSFTGTWRRPCDSRGGRLHFTLAADGQTFKGSWGNHGAAPTMSWNASRR